MNILKDWISEERLGRLSSFLETAYGQAVLSSNALASIGLQARFDRDSLELRLRVPPEIRKTNQVFLSGRGLPPNTEEALPPSAFSSFINARAGEDFNFGHNDGTDGRRPFHSDFDGAMNYRNWVLEGASTYASQQPHTFTRGDVRLIKDDPAHMIRYAVGDLSYPTSYFQRYRPMAGVTLASNFSLQPYRVTIPMSSNEIFLKTPSKVVVFVNGYQAQVLYLPAGRHDLRNLALGNGINFIRLEITDDVGRVEVLTFPWVSEADLLAKGLHQFSYSVGAPSTQVDNHRAYGSALVTASIFHRYGLTDQTTLGANLQLDHRQALAGLEFLDSNTFGTISLEPEVSRVRENTLTPGWATRARYIYTDYKGPRVSQRNFTLGLEYRSVRFAQFDDLAPNVVNAYQLQASYSQSIWADVAARFGGDYDLNRQNAPGVVNAYGASVSLVRSFTFGLQASLTLSRRVTQTNLREDDAFLLLSWVIPDSRHYVSVSEDTAREATRVDWRYNAAQLVGGANTALSYEHTPQANRADADLNYTANRAQFDVAHNLVATSATGNTSGNTAQTMNLRAGTALVLAGGKFALSRPVTDSFAVVATSNATSGQTMDINPNGNEYYDARTDWLGPGVVSNILSYQYYRLYLDPSKLEPGFELGQENYTLQPTYKSGTLIRAGTDVSVMLGGVLVDPRGRPVALEGGEVLSKSAPTAKPIVLFTNRKGKFRVEGFKPDTYVLSFYSDRWSPIEFTIPANIRGIYDIGRVTAHPLK